MNPSKVNQRAGKRTHVITLPTLVLVSACTGMRLRKSDHCKSFTYPQLQSVNEWEVESKNKNTSNVDGYMYGCMDACMDEYNPNLTAESPARRV